MKRATLLVLAFLTATPLVWGSPHQSAQDIYFRKAEAELREWNAKVDELQKKAEKTGTKTRAQFDGQLRIVKAKMNAARRKLSRLERSGEENWKGLREGADNALSHIKNAYEKTVSTLNKTEPSRRNHE